MFKTTSNNRQESLRRGGGWADSIIDGPENISVLERYEGLVRAVNNLGDRIKALPKESEERRSLGLEKLALQNSIAAVRKELKSENLANVSIEWCFLQVCREQLIPGQFKALVKAAYRLRDENSARAQELKSNA